MDKSSFSLFVVMAALVLLSGCTISSPPQQGYGDALPQGSESTPDQTTSGGTSNQMSQVVSGDSNIAEQMRICEEMESPRSMSCLEGIALNYEIPTICGNLVDNANCYTQMAIKYNKPQYCELIDDLEHYSEWNKETCRDLFE